MQRFLCPCTANAGHAAFSGELLPCFAACCSVLQHVAVCCSVLPRCFVRRAIAVCCSVLQCIAVCCSVLPRRLVRKEPLPCVAQCYRMLQCVAVCCNVLQRVAMCSVLSKFLVCRLSLSSLFSKRALISHKTTPHSHACCAKQQGQFSKEV